MKNLDKFIKLEQSNNNYHKAIGKLKLDKKEIFVIAWRIAKKASQRFNQPAKEFFSLALKRAWKIHKKGKTFFRVGSDGEVKRETEKAMLFNWAGIKSESGPNFELDFSVWMPKSLIYKIGNGFFIEEWIFDKKFNEIATKYQLTMAFAK